MTTTNRQLLLDPGMDLTLRSMRYPHLYDRFRDAITGAGRYPASVTPAPPTLS